MSLGRLYVLFPFPGNIFGPRLYVHKLNRIALLIDPNSLRLKLQGLPTLLIMPMLEIELA